jgi:triosephosphate isomerase
MNGVRASARELKRLLAALAARKPRCEVWLCPPATLLVPFAALIKGGTLRLGAQDCHVAPFGAHTGDLSAEMLRDAGARAVILGHSERRKDHHESNELVRAKAEAAFRAGLTAIVCVGETEAERDAGATIAVVRRQIEGSLPDGATEANTVVAYEPVWAIGTGRTPTPHEISGAHHEIRSLLARRLGAAASRIRILYGGSVKPDNAHAILTLTDVDGALVGGASLKATEFLSIIKVYAR